MARTLLWTLCGAGDNFKGMLPGADQAAFRGGTVMDESPATTQACDMQRRQFSDDLVADTK
jgi:hypothetical protein